MRSLRAPCLAIALCLCAVAIAPAVEARFAPTSPEAALAFAGPREQSLLAELNAGSLRSEDVFTAALTAQGTASESQFRAAGERLAGHVARLQGRLAPRATAAERARAAYAYLHGEVLTGQYVTECSDLTTTLERGDYNCLSATVLYLALCQGVAVPAEAVARPGHVYCRLAESGEAVETTCPQWFSLTAGQRRRSVPPGAVGSATQADRPLTTAELLAKIYYNRGLAEMGRRQFPAAIAHFALAARLDPRDAAARENVLAAMNNGALALGEAGQWAAAAELVLRGRAIDSRYAPLVANDLHIHRQWILALARQGRDAQAASILRDLARRQQRPELVGEWSRELGIEMSPAVQLQPAGL